MSLRAFTVSRTDHEAARSPFEHRLATTALHTGVRAHSVVARPCANGAGWRRCLPIRSPVTADGLTRRPAAELEHHASMDVVRHKASATAATSSAALGVMNASGSIIALLLASRLADILFYTVGARSTGGMACCGRCRAGRRRRPAMRSPRGRNVVARIGAYDSAEAPKSARDVEDGSSGTFDVMADDGSVELDVGAGLGHQPSSHCTASDDFKSAINKAERRKHTAGSKAAGARAVHA